MPLSVIKTDRRTKIHRKKKLASSEREDSPVSNEQVGERLFMLRAALQLNGETVGRMAGFESESKKSWSQLEHGERVLMPNNAARLRANVSGLTTDWLYVGDTGCMPRELLQKLEEGKRRINAALAAGRRWQPKPLTARPERRRRRA